MITTAKSKHLRAFLEGVPEDGTIDRYRSEALGRLAWAEESENDANVLSNQVNKIAHAFTVNTGTAIPDYVKPPRVNPRVSSGTDQEEEKKGPVKKAPSKRTPGKKAVKWHS